MSLRRVQPADGSRVASLFEHVFSAAEGPEEGAALAALVQRLVRSLGDDVQGYVATGDNDVQAAIFFSRLRFDDGVLAWLLSPVAVATVCQGQGIGQRLIRHGLASLAEQGAAFVVTYGDPAFYSRVGFSVIAEDIILPPFPLSQPHGWQCCMLDGSLLRPRAGIARCVPAFDDPSLW